MVLNKFHDTCSITFDVLALRKQKYERGNLMLFINKDTSKEILTKTRVRNKLLKDRCEEDKKKYSKQRSYCVLLFYYYFRNLNEKHFNDNKKFMKTIRHFLQNKVKKSE